MSSAAEAVEALAEDGFLVAGIGNPLRGDDGAGLVLGRAVAERTGNPYLECEDVPENYLAEMRNSEASTILLVDAADMGAAAGEIRLLDRHELSGCNISTHNCSLSVLADLLAEQCDKRVLLLAVQPASLQWGRRLTPRVADAIAGFVAHLPDDSFEKCGATDGLTAGGATAT